MHRPTRAAFAALALVAAIVVTGCSSTVSLHAAPDANDPACAEVTALLPGNLAGESRRWTDAQATGAWGEPAAVLFTCGVEPIGPTTLPCQTVNGVDWVIDESKAPQYRVTSYGRVPAVEVYLDNDVVSSADVLDGLSLLVSRLPADGATCLAREDAAPSD
ncbi:DUF3515 domain-containing protein [Microbacterium sp. SSM24]|uniref:DUF3515 domain-containing protein n=1 Tax=Microbacterium sp. SSM24 TaxID=2991714 RepID=UPI0022260C27|nr:DUF3515 domain-containing protein [Microbacterium sp. SSM24]MCW3494247.1 DUF3515 domain-containing protein [Microbacterium sp. SSM24]